MNVIQTNFTYSKPLIPLDINNINYIVLHHAEAITASPEDIHQWHLQNGWSGFGYAEYIKKDGTVYIGRGDHIGAQCQGYNSTSYGICCEGNYDKELLMPEVQKRSLIERIKINKTRFPNYKSTVPHSLLYSTECPGKYFPLNEILTRLETNRMENWKEILKQKTDSPDRWITAIETAINIAKSGNVGDLKVFEFLPQLIEKIGK